MTRCVIFDLDGTLTIASLDFDAIRREIGLDGEAILEAVERMDGADRQRAEEILNRHERSSAESVEFQPRARETVEALRERGYAVGVLTRNRRVWAEMMLEAGGVRVDDLVCREDGPIKPDPAGVLTLCRRFEADASRSWMVGDYRFDLEAGAAAGSRTALMIADGPVPDYADLADHVIRRLDEMLEIVAAPDERRRSVS